MFLQVGGLRVGMVSGNWPKLHHSSTGGSSSIAATVAAVVRCFVRAGHYVSEVIKSDT